MNNTMSMNLKRMQVAMAHLPAFLAVAGLVACIGCGRNDGAQKESDSGLDADRGARDAVEERLVDELAPPPPAGADRERVKVAERERDLTRKILALDKRREEVIRDQTLSDARTRELHQQMNEARDAYQRHVETIPEVVHIAKQKEMLRKHLNEARTLRFKLDGVQ